MPVYNVEPYLRNAIESVLSQTEQDFEIILVDDASPDNCPAICDEYAAKNENIKVVHHPENKGLSAVRNTGIAHASGEYVTFMDSDDFVDPDLLSSVRASLKENPADCVAFGMKEEYCDQSGEIKKTYEVTFGREERLNGADKVRPVVIELEQKTLYGYSANKFYKKDIITNNKIGFEKVALIEDIAFNVEFFNFASSLNILNTAPYHYMKRIDGSLTNKFVKDYYQLHRRRVNIILEQYRGWGLLTDGVKTALANIYARYIVSALQRNCDPRAKMNHRERKAFLRSVFADEMFLELSPFISAGSYAGILYGALKKQKTGISLVYGRAIYIIKQKLPILFAAAKQRR